MDLEERKEDGPIQMVTAVIKNRRSLCVPETTTRHDHDCPNVTSSPATLSEETLCDIWTFTFDVYYMSIQGQISIYKHRHTSTQKCFWFFDEDQVSSPIFHRHLQSQSLSLILVELFLASLPTPVVLILKPGTHLQPDPVFLCDLSNDGKPQTSHLIGLGMGQAEIVDQVIFTFLSKRANDDWTNPIDDSNGKPNATINSNGHDYTHTAERLKDPS